MRNIIITLALLLYSTEALAQQKYATSIKTITELKKRLQEIPVYEIPVSISFEYYDWDKNWKEIHNDSILKKQLLKLQCRLLKRFL